MPLCAFVINSKVWKVDGRPEATPMITEVVHSPDGKRYDMSFVRTGMNKNGIFTYEFAACKYAGFEPKGVPAKPEPTAQQRYFNQDGRGVR